MSDLMYPDDAVISSPSAVLSGWFIWISLANALGCKQGYRKKGLSQMDFSLSIFNLFHFSDISKASELETLELPTYSLVLTPF